MRLTPFPAAALMALTAACGSSSLSRSTAEKLIRPDYPAVAPVRVPRTATVEKGTAKFNELQAIHAVLQKDGSVAIQAKEEGTKVTYTYALSPKAPGTAKTTPAGFQLVAADVEFQRIQNVETRGNQARATYEVRLARPTGLFPAFQLIHPGAKIGQTKTRRAEFDKQDGKWGLLKTDEKLETKE
jgi:hypothetical protein